MQNIHIAGLSQEEVELAVMERCASFGLVNRVAAYMGRTGSPARSFAIVSMDTREDAERLAAAVGRPAMGTAVVVFLEHAASRVTVGRPVGPANVLNR